MTQADIEPYSFDTAVQFANGIENGDIRRKIVNPRLGLQRGDRIRIYFGRQLLLETTVSYTDPIAIDADGLRIYDGRTSSSETNEEVALALGFEDYAKMLAWVRSKHGLPFTGTVIHWGEW